MARRLLAALGATLLIVGTTFAQAPAPGTPAPPILSAGSPPWTLPPADTPAPTADGPASAGSPRLWASADYWLGWISGRSLPPLVTTGTASGGSAVLFGGQPVNTDLRSGFRAASGLWFGEADRLGIEVSLAMLESRATTFGASSDQVPVLTRPYVDATTFLPAAVVVASPGTSTGSIAVRAGSGGFYTGASDFAVKLNGDGPAHTDALFGYRYYQYREDLSIGQTIFPTGAAFTPGTQVQALDSFATRNVFNGFEVGVRPRFTWGALCVELLAKVALGDLHQTVNVNGSTINTVPGGAPATFSGGVLAQSTNLGAHSSDTFAVLPEFGGTIGWRITPNICLRVGYSALLLNQIARAGDQVNLSLNPTLFPNSPLPARLPNEPSFTTGRSNAWVQGGTVGIEVSY